MERPVGVTILAVLYFIGAAFAAMGGILFILGGSMLSGILGQSSSPAAAGTSLLALGGAVVGAICLVVAVLDFALGFGFIKLQNWARILAIVFTGISVVFGLLGMVTILAHLAVFQLVFQGVVLAIEIWILVYLFKAHVKQAFGATGF